MTQLSPAAKAAVQTVLDQAAERLRREGYRRGEDGSLRSPYDLDNHDLRDEMPHDQWRSTTLEAIRREDLRRAA